MMFQWIVQFFFCGKPVNFHSFCELVVQDWFPQSFYIIAWAVIILYFARAERKGKA